MDEHNDRRADVLIVGGGAAGLATAIFLARRRPDARIVVLDGAAKIGAKILVSGGGRCNVTNARVTPADFYGGDPRVVRRVLRAFSERDTRAFFERIGVRLHEEEHGKLFPDSNQARTVVNALLAECERRGVRVRTGHRVTSIRRSADAEPAGAGPDSFTIDVTGGERPQRWTARFVVLATGGLSLPRTGSDGFGYTLAQRLGHTLVPTTPALDPLVLDPSHGAGADRAGAPPLHAALSGITQEVELTLRFRSDRTPAARPVRIRGSMLWTHFGVSGPAALNASRFWNRAQLEAAQREPGDAPAAAITANFLPGRDFERAEREWLAAAQRQPRARVASLLREGLPARVAEALLAALGVPADLPAGQLRREDRRRLLHALRAWPLPVVGTRGYRYAEVTAGGVPLSEIDPATMQSRVCPGLLLVGEILDVDGRIGGFNFQWAWSSGSVAAGGLAALLAGMRPE